MLSFLKRLRPNAGKAASPGSGGPEVFQLVAVGPTGSGKTAHWYMTGSRSAEGSQREIRFSWNELAPGEKGDGSIVVDHDIRNGRLHPGATVEAKRGPANLRLTGAVRVGSEIRIDIRDIPGEWVSMRKHADELRKRVDGSHLLVIVLSPEFVYSDHTDDYVMRVFESCITTVRDFAARSTCPPFVAICYSKCDEYGFTPGPEPRLLRPEDVLHFSPSETMESICAAARRASSVDSGNAACDVIRRTWRLFETLLAAKVRFGVYWVSALSATPAFKPAASQGVHHVLADFVKHLLHYRRQPLRLWQCLGIGAALVGLLLGFGWLVSRGSAQVEAIRNFVAWTDRERLKMGMSAKDFAKWETEVAKEHGTASRVHVFGSLVRMNEALRDRQEHIRSAPWSESAAFDKEGFESACGVLQSNGLASVCRLVKDTLLDDADAERALLALIGRDPVKSDPPAEATGTPSNGGAVEGAMSKSNRATPLSDPPKGNPDDDIRNYVAAELRARTSQRIQTFARFADTQVLRAESFVGHSTDRLLARIFGTRDGLDGADARFRAVNRRVSAFLLNCSSGELDEYSKLQNKCPMLPKSPFERPKGKDWAQQPWTGNPNVVDFTTADDRKYRLHYQQIDVRVGSNDYTLRMGEEHVIKDLGLVVLRTDDKQNPLSVQAPHLLELRALRFDLREEGWPSDKRIVCDVAWTDPPVWAPSVQAFFSNVDDLNLAKWRDLAERHIKLTCNQWQGNNQTALTPGDREFQAIREFFERWNPRPK